MVLDYLRQGSFSSVGHLLGPLMRPAWNAYRTAAGLFLFAAAFALLLSYLTAGSGAVIIVDGPPQGDFTTADSPYGRNRQRLRVPLGGEIKFDSMWHIGHGGCERVITSSLTQGTDEEGFGLVQRRRGEVFPVGRPGRHHIARKLPDGVKAGLYRYQAVGVATCPTRVLPPVQYADFDVEVFDPDGPVQIGHGTVLLTRTATVGGSIRYRESFERTDDTPSLILLTFTLVSDGKPEIIAMERPGAITRAGMFRDVVITEMLPPQVRAGHWKMSKTAISTRPGGRTRVDHLFTVEFDVVP